MSTDEIVAVEASPNLLHDQITHLVMQYNGEESSACRIATEIAQAVVVTLLGNVGAES